MYVVKVHNPYNNSTWYQGPFDTRLDAEQWKGYCDSVTAYERTLLTKEQYLNETDAPLLPVTGHYFEVFEQRQPPTAS